MPAVLRNILATLIPNSCERRDAIRGWRRENVWRDAKAAWPVHKWLQPVWILNLLLGSSSQYLRFLCRCQTLLSTLLIMRYGSPVVSGGASQGNSVGCGKGVHPVRRAGDLALKEAWVLHTIGWRSWLGDVLIATSFDFATSFCV